MEAPSHKNDVLLAHCKKHNDALPRPTAPNVCKLGEAWCPSVFRHNDRGGSKFRLSQVYQSADLRTGRPSATASFLHSVKEVEAYAHHGVCGGYRSALWS